MPFPSKAYSRQAHAKLNLALSVGSPRPPKGYHPIASWMVLLELADTVEFLPPGAGLTHEICWADDAPRPSPIDWPLERDLAVRALALVADRLPKVRLRITKRVPVGGGLGGGSSDAAAVLLLAREMDPTLTAQSLLDAGATLGSDVCFFVRAEEDRHSMVVSGFGDRVEPATRRIPQTRVDLVLPEFGCPTATVYSRWDDLNRTPRDPDAAAVHSLVNSQFDPALGFNDLEAPASALFPELSRWLSQIRATGRHALLAGSGSTIACFGPPLESPPDSCGLIRTRILG